MVEAAVVQRDVNVLFLHSGQFAFTMMLSLSSCMSRAGVQPLNSCEVRGQSVSGASNKRSISSRKSDQAPKSRPGDNQVFAIVSIS